LASRNDDLHRLKGGGLCREICRLFERQLLLAADTPAVTLQAGIKPDSAPDLVTLVVNGFERWTPIYQADSFQTVPDSR
jgi:hypothetical protein